ncbi:MAG: molybdate ABC transporter substrate-binding protein [Deltaproteobacteria bacterium]|nr:molybdate ABC transporter substrate-binding protein [Deltaproteobacteria bacterium]
MRLLVVAFFIALTALSALNAHADKKAVTVAVSANALAPVKEIAAAFEKKTGVKVTVISGSTGKLYSQIEQGAPFDIFLSADNTHTVKLEDKGLAIKGSRFVYAEGSLALAIKKDYSTLDIKAALSKAKKIAIANPSTAPYGAAAIEALKRLGIHSEAEKKFVYGESAAQAYAFFKSGNVDAAFIPLSSVYGAGSTHIPVDAKLHTPILQEAVLLKNASKEAAEFANFLKSAKSLEIFKKYGYTVITAKKLAKP